MHSCESKRSAALDRVGTSLGSAPGRVWTNSPIRRRALSAALVTHSQPGRKSSPESAKSPLSLPQRSRNANRSVCARAAPTCARITASTTEQLRENKRTRASFGPMPYSYLPKKRRPRPRSAQPRPRPEVVDLGKGKVHVMLPRRREEPPWLYGPACQCAGPRPCSCRYAAPTRPGDVPLVKPTWGHRSYSLEEMTRLASAAPRGRSRGVAATLQTRGRGAAAEAGPRRLCRDGAAAPPWR